MGRSSGNLKYNDTIDLWAIELGEFVGAFEHAFHPAVPGTTNYNEEIVEEINERLRSNNIPCVTRFLTNTERQRRLRVVEQILNSVARASETHCALVMIGSGAYTLREMIHRVSEGEKQSFINTAKNRITEIVNYCSSLTTSWEVLSDVFAKLPPIDLSTSALRRFFREAQRPLCLLVMSAEPIDQDTLRLGEEARVVSGTLRMSRFRDAFTVQQTQSTRVRDIPRILDEFDPSILHFSGHGNNSGLCFEDNTGRAQIVEADALADIFEDQKRLQLVVLNACSSASQAQTIANKVGYVIGMEGEIEDADAIEFTRQLYAIVACRLTQLRFLHSRLSLFAILIFAISARLFRLLCLFRLFRLFRLRSILYSRSCPIRFQFRHIWKYYGITHLKQHAEILHRVSL